MRKPKLLYISPLWPVHSGISEYSESLLKGLNEYFDITVLIDNYKVEHDELLEKFNICHKDKILDFSKYDYYLYNFGNNPDAHEYMYDLFLEYPGEIILHDLSLYYLTVEHYRQKGRLFEKIYEMEGTEGITIVKDTIKNGSKTDLLLYKELAAKLLLNDEIIGNATRIFVHSEYSKNKILEKFHDAEVHVIPLVNCMPHIKSWHKFNLRKKFNIREDEIIIGSAGFIAPSKQCELCCQAVLEYNQSHMRKIHYVMVGEGDYVDSYLNEYIHKTNRLDNEDFFSALSECDLIFNLRYPYNGESSATLLQCMMLKKRCVVTDIGWFSELDDGIVYKVPQNISYEELSVKIDEFLEENEIQEKAYKYSSQQCSEKEVAKMIFEKLHMKETKTD